MPKSKFISFIIYAVAIWLVLSFITAIVPLAFKGWQQAQQPAVSSIVSGLKSGSQIERKAALDKIKHPIWNDKDVIAAVSEMALQEQDPYLKARAITLSLQGYSRYSNLSREQITNAKDKPALTLDKIDKITDLVLDEKIESNLGTNSNPVYNSLYIFLQNTVNSQSDPYIYIKHFTVMLEGVLVAEATHRRISKLAILIQALKGYAAYVVLPKETINILLSCYYQENKSYNQIPSLIMETFNNQASKQVFSDEVMKTIESAAVTHKNRTLRLTAITALSQQSILTNKLSPALEKAVSDKHEWNGQVANNAIARFKEVRSDKSGQGQDGLLVTAFDKSQKPEIRATSLRRGISVKNGRFYINPKFFKAAESLLKDEEPKVRGASVYYIRHMYKHELYQQRQKEIQGWFEDALNDKDAIVRAATMHVLEKYPDNNSKSSEYVLHGLQDRNRKVLLAALRVVNVKKLNTPEIEKQLNQLTNHKDTAVKSTAKRYHKYVEAKNRNILETIIETVNNQKNFGGLLYLAAAIIASIVAGAFAIYYAYTFIKHLEKRRARAIGSLIVLLIWVTASYALGASFVVGLFGMGHNTPAPLDEQLKITYSISALVIGYTILGFIMSLFVRLPKKDVE